MLKDNFFIYLSRNEQHIVEIDNSKLDNIYMDTTDSYFVTFIFIIDLFFHSKKINYIIYFYYFVYSKFLFIF